MVTWTQADGGGTHWFLWNGWLLGCISMQKNCCRISVTWKSILYTWIGLLCLNFCNPNSDQWVIHKHFSNKSVECEYILLKVYRICVMAVASVVSQILHSFRPWWIKGIYRGSQRGNINKICIRSKKYKNPCTLMYFISENCLG